MLFYLGTYTQRGGVGVLGCELGAENAMRVIGSVFLKDPTYVIANARRDRLFCVCEAPAEGEEGGSAASFSLGETARLCCFPGKTRWAGGPVTCASRRMSGFCT